MQEQVTFRLDLSPITDQESAMALKKSIEGIAYVKHVDYISKEEAAKIFVDDLGDDFVDFLGYNPLSPALMVNLRADLVPDNQSGIISQFKHDINQMPGIEKIAYQENVVSELNEIYYKVSWFLVLFICLVLLLSVVLISSTIRIALYAQRDTIRSMRMVGAKVGFIAHPFIVRGMLYGVLGGLIAALLTIGVMYLFNNQLNLAINLSDHYLWYAGIAVILVLVGMVISFFSTMFNVRRYVRKIDYED